MMTDDGEARATTAAAREQLVAFVLDEAGRRVLKEPDTPLGEAVARSIRDVVRSEIAAEVAALTDEDAARLARAMTEERRRTARLPLAGEFHVSPAAAAILVLGLAIAFGLGFATHALTAPPVALAYEVPEPVDPTVVDTAQTIAPADAVAAEATGTPTTIAPAANTSTPVSRPNGSTASSRPTQSPQSRTRQPMTAPTRPAAPAPQTASPPEPATIPATTAGETPVT